MHLSNYVCGAFQFSNYFHLAVAFLLVICSTVYSFDNRIATFLWYKCVHCVRELCSFEGKGDFIIVVVLAIFNGSENLIMEHT